MHQLGVAIERRKTCSTDCLANTQATAPISLV